jgi:hypothetical protein
VNCGGLDGIFGYFALDVNEFYFLYLDSHLVAFSTSLYSYKEKLSSSSNILPKGGRRDGE